VPWFHLEIFSAIGEGAQWLFLHENIEEKSGSGNLEASAPACHLAIFLYF
jgi:hypothetical protein